MKKIHFTLILVLLITAESYSREYITPEGRTDIIRNGIGLGSVIAGITSWERNKSVLLSIIHAIFSWFYVIYFVLTRRKQERR